MNFIIYIKKSSKSNVSKIITCTSMDAFVSIRTLIQRYIFDDNLIENYGHITHECTLICGYYCYACIFD